LLPILGLVMWPRRSADDVVAVIPEATTTTTDSGLFGPAPAAARPRWDGSRALWPTNRAIATVVAFALLLGLLEHHYILKYSFKRKADGATAGQEYFKKKWMQYERHYVHNFYAWRLMPVVNVPMEARPARGAANAVHTVVIFSDFECPACSKFETYLMKQVLPLKTKTGQPAFKVVFKHWPICKDCNDLMTGDTLHPAACQAALAAEAARILGGDEAFWKMHDLLFANQAAWRKSRDFRSYARQIGLDEDAFVKAMDGPEALNRVREDIADGVRMGSELESATRRAEMKVDSTPTIFVDGRRLNSPQFAKTWQGIMEMPVPPPGAAAANAASRPAGN
jgi:protein-disulfide isomerase